MSSSSTTSAVRSKGQGVLAVRKVRILWVEFGEAGGDDRIGAELEYKPGWLARALGAKPAVEALEFFGGCTVWRDASTGERQSTRREALFARAWALARYRTNSRRGGARCVFAKPSHVDAYNNAPVAQQERVTGELNKQAGVRP